MDINLGYYNRICPLLKNEWFKGGVEPNRRASPYKWVGCQRIVSLIGNSAGRQSTASFSIIRYQSIASRGLPNSILFLSSHRRQKDYQHRKVLLRNPGKIRQLVLRSPIPRSIANRHSERHLSLNRRRAEAWSSKVVTSIEYFILQTIRANRDKMDIFRSYVIIKFT